MDVTHTMMDASQPQSSVGMGTSEPSIQEMGGPQYSEHSKEKDEDRERVGNMEEGGKSHETIVPVSFQPPPFLLKTYEMVEDEATNAMVSWNVDGKSFIVWNPPEFARDMLPKYFKHSNFSSFVRQLNTYGFRKIDTDKWAFAHDNFRRGHKDLLKDIHRRRANPHADKVGSSQQISTVPGMSGHQGAFIEVGKYGLENEIDQLKRDKHILMMELIRVRNQQQEMQLKMENYSSRLERQEKIANNVMTFLSNAVQNPSVLGQFMSRAQSLKGKNRVRKRRQINADGTHMDIGGDEGGPQDSGMALAIHSPMKLNWPQQQIGRETLPLYPVPDSIMRMNTSELISSIADTQLLENNGISEEQPSHHPTVNLEELPSQFQEKSLGVLQSPTPPSPSNGASPHIKVSQTVIPDRLQSLPDSPGIITDQAPMTDQDFNDMMGMFEHSDLDGLSGIDMNNVQDLLDNFQSSSFRVQE